MNTPLDSHFDLDSRDTYNPVAQSSSALSHQASQLPCHDQYQLSGIAVIENTLALSWSDGTEQFFSLSVLREACPCAVCEGESDVMGNKVILKKQLRGESFLLKKYEFVGGYGIQFFWGDGHSTGIYSYRYLRGFSNE